MQWYRKKLKKSRRRAQSEELEPQTCNEVGDGSRSKHVADELRKLKQRQIEEADHELTDDLFEQLIRCRVEHA
jgi:hypothetical protein